MKLWRLTRAAHVALDGEGAARSGGRYSPPGRPVIPFASEPGLSVLIALRYLPEQRSEWPGDHVLGWTEVDAIPLRSEEHHEDDVRRSVVGWLDERASLLLAIPSRVLPEADVVLMNPLHEAFSFVKPLVVRPFSFEACLHRPPMLERYQEN